MSTGVIPGVGPVSLLERQVELEHLEHLPARACEGLGAVVVIQGAAGIGKTASLRSLAGRGAERGFW